MPEQVSWEKSDPSLVERFDRALPEHPALLRRKMFGYPSAFVNGNYFTGLHAHRVLIRLPGRIVDAIPELTSAEHFDPRGTGRGLADWYVIPGPIAADRDRLAALLAAAVEKVAALPPKEPKPRKRPSRRTADPAA